MTFLRYNQWILHCDGWVVSSFEKCPRMFSIGYDSAMDTVRELARAEGWSVPEFGVSAYCPEHRLT